MKKTLIKQLMVEVAGFLDFACVDQEKDFSDQKVEDNNGELNIACNVALKSEKATTSIAKNYD